MVTCMKTIYAKNVGKDHMKNKQLSNLMLLSNFICTLFYSMSYPYIYAEMVKVVSHGYISFEQIANCISIVIFSVLWNRYGDTIFKHYMKIVIFEIIADAFLFGHVIITGNIQFYFVLNVLIYAIITKNMSCGGIKMRAKVNPDEKSRERFDNNSNVVYAIATLLGTAGEVVFNFDLKSLFILALIGGTIDNFFYIYIYNKIKST